MSSPIDPEVCKKTGRLLTEWFEFPEFTDEQLRERAYEEVGVDPDNPPRLGKVDNWGDDDESVAARKIANFINKRKGTKFKHGMSNQEVQQRMNEATKMVGPDNFKFLPDDVRERTGLELNPLWQMECLYRSGILDNKESVQVLKELAAYTHSKAPSVSHSTNTQMKPEDWLVELAKDEYDVIEPDQLQPKTPIEAGFGKQYEKRKRKKTEEVGAISKVAEEELANLENQIEDVDFEEVDLNDTD